MVQHFDERRSPEHHGARYVLRFVCGALPLFVAYSYPYSEQSAPTRWFTSYLATYAEVTGAALRLLEPSLRVTGNVIHGHFAVQVAKSCDAMDACILFAAAVLAFPAPWPRRLVALGAGVLLLAVANVARIAALYFIGWLAPSAFDAAHLEWFPLILLLLGVGQFALWTRWLSRPAQPLNSGG